MLELTILFVFTIILAIIYFVIFTQTENSNNEIPIVIYINLAESYEKIEFLTREVILPVAYQIENAQIVLFYSEETLDAVEIFKRITMEKIKYTLVKI